MATEAKKNGMTLPSGIYQPTTRPEPAAAKPAEQGADRAEELTVEPVEPAGAKAPKGRKRKAAAPSEKVEDMNCT